MNRVSYAWIMCKIFFLIPSKKPFNRETDNRKGWAILKIFNFGILKLSKHQFCQIAKFQRFFWKYYHSRIDFLQNCSAFYTVSFSSERFFEGTRENISGILDLIQKFLLLSFRIFFIMNSSHTQSVRKLATSGGYICK